MATSSGASARSILKLSRSSLSPPRSFFSMTFKPTGTTPLSLEKTQETQMPFLVSGAAKRGSLGAATHPLELPTPLGESPLPLSLSKAGGKMGLWTHNVMWYGDYIYKVVLIDDLRHTEKLVEKALPNIIPSITASEARELFHMSRQECFALVATVDKKMHAKFIVQMMMQWGLRSAIVPPAGVC